MKTGDYINTNIYKRIWNDITSQNTSYGSKVSEIWSNILHLRWLKNYINVNERKKKHIYKRIYEAIFYTDDYWKLY